MVKLDQPLGLKVKRDSVAIEMLARVPGEQGVKFSMAA